MREIGIRTGLILLFVVGYFTLLRPVRSMVNKLLFTPVVEQTLETSNIFSLNKDVSSVSNRVIIGTPEDGKEIYVTVPFGLHFLLALTGLAAIGGAPRFYGYLIIIQVAAGIITLLSFYLAGVISIHFTILTDLTVRYLNPLCSLGIVPITFIYKYQAFDEQ